MVKALKRTGWVLSATGALALAYHVGTLTSPSSPYEPLSYDAADLAAPTPVVQGSSPIEVESEPASEIMKVAGTVPKARIISITAIHRFNDSGRNGLGPSPTLVPGDALRAQAKRPAKSAIVALSSASPQAGSHFVSPKPSSLNSSRPIIPAKHEEPAARSAETKMLPAPLSSGAKKITDLAPPKVLPLVLPDLPEKPEKSVTETPAMNGSQAQKSIFEKPAAPSTAPPAMLPAVYPTPVLPPAPRSAAAPSPFGEKSSTATFGESAGAVFRESSCGPGTCEPLTVAEQQARVSQALNPPRQLPVSIMDSAPLVARQKLIARSIGTSTGVASRLANAQLTPADQKNGFVLASAALESEQAASQQDDSSLKPYATTGTVSLRSSREEIAAQAHLDYVTSGLVILPAAERPRITPPASVQETFLRSLIQKACGEKIRNLQVALQSNQSLNVAFSAANDTEREELTRTIFTLPELAAYRLTVSVEVVP